MMNDHRTPDTNSRAAECNYKHVQAVVVENFRAIYQPCSALEKTKAQFRRRGFHVYQTPHFLVARVPSNEVITLVHTFSEEEIDNNVVHYLMQELAPRGLITSDQAFGAALISVVTSILPTDPVSAWGFFTLNTLQRLRAKLDDTSLVPNEDFIASFAAIYRRLLDLKVGASLLDVGCACAFWPLLVAERTQEKYSRIVGVDNRLDAINLSSHLATLVGIDTIEFVLADVLTPEFSKLGMFDTVTAIHLLEHLPEDQIPLALSNLLNVTRQRLLIAVPYEDRPEIAYGHELVCNREKLEAWGKWCIDHLHGKGKVYCEDVHGGLLMVERDKAL